MAILLVLYLQIIMKEILVSKGAWLYDNVKPMPVRIYKLNYDFYFEMDRGYHDEGQRPELNEFGEQFVILWTDAPFSRIADPTLGGLTLDTAKATAESIVQQKIQWENS